MIGAPSCSSPQQHNLAMARASTYSEGGGIEGILASTDGKALRKINTARIRRLNLIERAISYDVLYNSSMLGASSPSGRACEVSDVAKPVARRRLKQAAQKQAEIRPEHEQHT
eukprot:1394583-Pleurochrysis_carterae.AAC.2